jgi:hypothetical protein
MRMRRHVESGKMIWWARLVIYDWIHAISMSVGLIRVADSIVRPRWFICANTLRLSVYFYLLVKVNKFVVCRLSPLPWQRRHTWAPVKPLCRVLWS